MDVFAAWEDSTNREGRLYWVVNSVREILQVKDRVAAAGVGHMEDFWGHARKMCNSEDLNSLHQVNFPLTLRMQD